MQKILICVNYDGLYLNNKALIRYAELSNLKYKVRKSEVTDEEYVSLIDDNEKGECIWEEEISRDDKALIQLSEELGDKICRFDWVKFKIVEIPDDIKWSIEGGGEGCGELIREVSRIWN